MNLRRIALAAGLIIALALVGVWLGRMLQPAPHHGGAELHALIHGELDLDPAQEQELTALERQFAARRAAITGGAVHVLTVTEPQEFVPWGDVQATIEAEAQERAVKGRTGVYAVSVFGEDGRIIAEFQGLSRTIGGPVIEEEQE